MKMQFAMLLAIFVAGGLGPHINEFLFTLVCIESNRFPDVVVFSAAIDFVPLSNKRSGSS